MSKIKRYFCLVTSLLLFLWFFWSAPVFAKTNPLETLVDYNISVLEVKVAVEKNGQVEITEDFSLSNPTDQFIWRFDLPVENVQFWASGQPVGKSLVFKKEEGVLNAIAVTKEKHTHWTIRYQAPEGLTRESDWLNDRLFLVLVLRPQTTISRLNVEVHLPGYVEEQDLKQRVYAVHGVLNYRFEQVNPSLLRYSAFELSPYATFSIETRWPVGMVQYPFLRLLRFWFAGRSGEFWLAIGFLLPFLSFVFYLYILFLSKESRRLKGIGYLNHPPSDLPPALVHLLLREKANQRQIVATLFDLARRGFIEIIKKEKEYILAKRQGQGGMWPFEVLLYDKLFTEKGIRKIKRTEFELKKRAKEQFYSPKVTAFYQLLYQEACQRGLFAQGYFQSSRRYRLWGILFFFSAVFTAALALLFSSGPPYALIGAVGQILASFLIIQTASMIPQKTEKGQKELIAWLSFREFLGDRKPFDFSIQVQGLFEKYLPYAVALEKEVAWVDRFKGMAIALPSWYVSYDPPSPEGFVSSLFYVANSVSRTLHSLREPGL